MPETAKMLIVLTLISAAASLGLAAFNEHAQPKIAENERLFTLRSIKKVIPDSEKPNPCEKTEPKFDNSPDQDSVCLDGTIVYRARKGEEVIGLAFVSIGDEAYSGTITCLVGLDMNGMVTGVEILKHAETPGLGAIIEDCDWRKQLIGQAPASAVWKVVKDGGKIEHISGATISSRSVIDAITKSIALFDQKKDQILKSKALKQGEVCNAG